MDAKKVKPRCKHLLTSETCAACLGLPKDPAASHGLDDRNGGGAHLLFVMANLGMLPGSAFVECDGDTPAENAGSML